MNLAKLIKGLQAEQAPLVEERDKIRNKLYALECKEERLCNAIEALREAEGKLYALECKEERLCNAIEALREAEGKLQEIKDRQDDC